MAPRRGQPPDSEIVVAIVCGLLAAGVAGIWALDLWGRWR